MNMGPRHRSARSRAFTLVELLVTVGIVAFMGGVIYVMLNGGTVLYTKIFQISTVQQTARSSMQAMSARMYEAVEQPTLTDAGGNDLPAIDANGDGDPSVAENWVPAAGVKFRIAVGHAHKLTRDAGSTDSAIYVATSSSPIITGDIVITPYPQISAPVTGVVTSGAELTLQFGKTLGELSLPPQATPKPAFVATNSPAYVERMSLFIAVPIAGTNSMELRYYPVAKSVGTDGAAAFNDRANYRVLASNLRADNGGALPFSFTGDPTAAILTRDPEYRAVRVNLQIQAREYDSRKNAAFNSNLAVNSALVWKSAEHEQFATADPLPVVTPTPTPALAQWLGC